MFKRHILSSVGVIGLAGGLAASPAYATEAEDEADTIALEARGTFQGFRIQPNDAIIALPDQAAFVLRSTTGEVEATPVAPTPEIIARDDVGLAGSVDVNDTQPSVVQLFSQRNSDGGIFFNCTGTVINPRTILTAAHCLNVRSSEAYGLPETGAARTVLVSTGVDSGERFFNYFTTGNSYSAGGVASSTDVIIHPSSNLDEGDLPFPWADIALVALDEPITDVPAMPILLSPLSELTHVIQVGYGGFGTAATGDIGIGFLRRVGENMLGAVASPADLIDTTFPGFAPSATTFGTETQAFYFTDFDNPDRVGPGQDRCTFDGFGITCENLQAVLDIDWFAGDALPNEVGTAGGDSGSPLIADQLGGPPVVTAVLSGGFDFFGVGNTYGDISFYNPLYPFFEFITENTPYKYVSAKRGIGLWSDPNRWTQDLDPGFLIDDGTGNLVNGIPAGSEPGVYETGPKLGTILGVDISGNSDLQSIDLPPEGTPNFGGNTPESSVLLGPGSTGFVPNNTDGTPGTSFANPAQYFDVILNRFGGTVVDMDVEIDKLTLDHVFAGFVLPEEYAFRTIIGYEQFNGLAQIDGTFEAGLVALFGGLTTGEGTIASPAVFNLSAGIAPGGLFGIGTLTIDGDYIQASEGTLLANVQFNGRNADADLLAVTGDASLAGNLIVSGRRGVRFGREATILTASSVLGDFDDVFLITGSPLLFAETRVEGGDVIVSINALRLRDLFGQSKNLASLGAALDTLRFEGRFDEFVGLFDVIDNAGIGSLVPTLSSLTPISAFEQSFVANSFSQRFTGQLGQRTLSLRGANGAAAGFSSAGGATFAIAGTNPQDAGKLGFFSTVSGSFLASAAERNTGTNAFEEAAFTQAGELTLGADMRVSDHVAVGFAMTNIRNSASNAGASFRPDDTSIAAAAYAAAQFGQGFADMYVGFSRQNYGVERTSSGDFALAYASAQGAAEGRQTFAGMRVGYAIDVAPGFEVGPVASVDFVRSNIGGYDEVGAGLFGLTVHERSFTSVGTKFGLMGALDTQVGRTGTLSAFGSVAYARELADSEDVVTANFFGAPDVPFSIVNALDPEWVSVNAGIELSLGSRLSLSASGTSDLGRGVLTNNQGRMTISWKF
ncbi:autotransporter domain-containing protein [Erythrobacter sp. JK5]|uniref:autotransporter domain-containing protein n=1 Tax=Erythrobacter sp. JK5 TaxID=2829500 RepID=UPI001BAD3912|nr:autotransporter domain-containing protein [Erythrobacter sp. JK5]QUL36649.1 autotransporter domain-containing protein [Erythrobacter sp. JK5]